MSTIKRAVAKSLSGDLRGFAGPRSSSAHADYRVSKKYVVMSYGQEESWIPSPHTQSHEQESS